MNTTPQTDRDEWQSERFARLVRLTRHARDRMVSRRIERELVADLVETGTIKRKDARRLWIYKHYADRTDNLICIAVAEEDALIVKTVMTRWVDRG